MNDSQTEEKNVLFISPDAKDFIKEVIDKKIRNIAGRTDALYMKNMYLDRKGINLLLEGVSKVLQETIDIL